MKKLYVDASLDWTALGALGVTPKTKTFEVRVFDGKKWRTRTFDRAPNGDVAVVNDSQKQYSYGIPASPLFILRGMERPTGGTRTYRVDDLRSSGVVWS